MSKNSKNAKRTAAAKERNRAKGFKGPAQTAPAHGKKKAWYQVGTSNNASAKGKGRKKEEATEDVVTE